MFKRFLSIVLVILMLSSVSLFTASANDETVKSGDIITFGSYPQSLVEDENLAASLNSLKIKWNSYGYMKDQKTGNKDGFMYYADVEFNGEKYRAVRIDEYRYSTYHSRGSSTTDSCQTINGYEKNKIYWFKYEPISWIVINEKKGLILSEFILDSQPYNELIFKDSNKYLLFEGSKVLANEHKFSYLRNWLNGTFYDTAFSSKEKKQIISTTQFIKDSTPTESVEDDVLLLTFYELENLTIYTPSLCTTKGTDYSKSQGLKVYQNHDGEYSHWRLRTIKGPQHPLDTDGDGAKCISHTSLSPSDVCTHSTNTGIRPALTISFEEEKGFFDKIIEFFENLFNPIIKFFQNIFSF